MRGEKEENIGDEQEGVLLKDCVFIHSSMSSTLLTERLFPDRLESGESFPAWMSPLWGRKGAASRPSWGDAQSLGGEEAFPAQHTRAATATSGHPG